MRRTLIWIGVLLAGATIGLALWIKEQRAGDDYECALSRLRDQTGCDVTSWWPAIGLGLAAAAVFVLASQVDRTNDPV